MTARPPGLRLVLATANPDKAAEIIAILGTEGVALSPRPAAVPDVEETGDTLVDNARLKARAISAAVGEPAVSDDTGLEVDALGGAPGIYTARYAGEDATYADNVAKLLTELDGTPAPDRGARFVAVAFVSFPDGTEIWAEGVVEGTIASESRGTDGFGYDPVFVPNEGDGRTFAEMGSAEKHVFSHRGRAFRGLATMIGDRAD